MVIGLGRGQDWIFYRIYRIYLNFRFRFLIQIRLVFQSRRNESKYILCNEGVFWSYFLFGLYSRIDLLRFNQVLVELLDGFGIELYKVNFFLCCLQKFQQRLVGVLVGIFFDYRLYLGRIYLRGEKRLKVNELRILEIFAVVIQRRCISF